MYEYITLMYTVYMVQYYLFMVVLTDPYFLYRSCFIVVTMALHGYVKSGSL